MLLSLLPDRGTELERETGREGRGSLRGSCTRKRVVLPQKDKVLGLVGVDGFKGGWASALQGGIAEDQPNHNP